MTDNEYALIELDKEVRHNEIVRQINERRRIDAETSRLETLDKRIEEALEYSGISYADPIEWDNRRNFKSGTVTTYEGDAYLSKKFVPIGISITDTEYWQPISVSGTLFEVERKERTEADEKIFAMLGSEQGLTKQQVDDLWEGR